MFSSQCMYVWIISCCVFNDPPTPGINTFVQTLSLHDALPILTHDGLGKYFSQVITKAPGPTDDIVGILKATRTDVVVSYLPVGSEMATKWYVEQIGRPHV